MIRHQWKSWVLVTVMFSVQGAFAGDAWLIITSNPPGAEVSVDDTYRGTTPQQMGDALRIQVSEGVRQIHAQKRLGEQEYTARQTIKVVQGRENQVQFDLRQEPTLVAVPLEVAPSGKLEPSGQFEIPGKNF